MLWKFGASRSASTAIEYGMIALLIATVVAVALPAIGTNLAALFGGVSAAFHH